MQQETLLRQETLMQQDLLLQQVFSVPIHLTSILYKFPTDSYTSIPDRRLLLSQQVFSISISGDHRSAQISSTSTDASLLDSFRFLLTPTSNRTPYSLWRPLLQRMLFISIQKWLKLSHSEMITRGSIKKCIQRLENTTRNSRRSLMTF